MNGYDTVMRVHRENPELLPVVRASDSRTNPNAALHQITISSPSRERCTDATHAAARASELTAKGFCARWSPSVSSGLASRYAVRSSALDEDGEHSFAGLHMTLLNVAPEGALDAYREVIASLFASAALRYRVEHHLPVAEALMPVGFLEMIPAASSGVLHTMSAATPERDVLVVSAAWGLGPTVVAGAGPTDSFELSRDPMPRILSRRLGDKALAVRPRRHDGVEPAPVPASVRLAPCISAEALLRLAQGLLPFELPVRGVLADRGRPGCPPPLPPPAAASAATQVMPNVSHAARCTSAANPARSFAA